MKFSIITCSFNNLEGLKAVAEALRAEGAGGQESGDGEGEGRDITPSQPLNGSLAAGASFGQAARKRPGSYGQATTPPIQIEHIIIDGGSTDGTGAWLEEMTLESRVHAVSPEERSHSGLQNPKFSQSEVEAPHRDGDSSESGTGGSETRAVNRTWMKPPQDGTLNYSFRWISEPDKGLYDALNKGLKLATCDLLYVDADDISKVKRVWKSGRYDPKKWVNGWMPPHPALFVTRELAERVGNYRLDLGSAADYEWMLRAGLVHGARFQYLPETLVRMRVGGQSNVSVQGRLKAHGADRRAWELNGLTPKPWTLKMKVIRKIPQWVRALRGMADG